MRTATLTGPAALRERMVAKIQIDATVPESACRLHENCFWHICDCWSACRSTTWCRMRGCCRTGRSAFFYLDRSWTDRLVDGAIAVGKIGTREQAHHQAHAANLNSQLDLTERVVECSSAGAGEQ